MLEINPPCVTIKDLGSLNGTYVNGIKHGGRPEEVSPEDADWSAPIALRNGDLIKAGNYSFELIIEGAGICVDCGEDIPSQDLKSAEFVGGTYLCFKCRARQLDIDISLPQQGIISMDLDQRRQAEAYPSRVLDDLIQHALEQSDEEMPEIEGYRDLKKIGEGGFGVVYRAIRTLDNETVALKTMLQTRQPYPKQKELFEREKQIALQLNHQNIVTCNRAGVWGDIHYIEMEYMDGGCVLDLVVNQGDPISVEQAVPLMIQTLEGLAYAHQVELNIQTNKGLQTVTGVVHRDIKPTNILITNQQKPLYKLADFGLSKAFAAAGYTQGSLSCSSDNSFCGTPSYMAPEHLVNYRYVEPPADVFEIAATFYHLLTGHTVWDGDSGADIYKQILEAPVTPIREVNDSIPTKLATVIDKALNREVKSRYINGGAMLNALKKAL
jgi:eukaryotic-like serine/threonine-protein kinase